MKISKVLIPTNYSDPYWQSPNFDDIRAYILYSLGWPNVRIELQDVQLNVAVHDAISKFLKYGYGQHHIDMKVVMVDAQGFADLPPEVGSPAMVKDIIFMSKTLDTGLATDILGEHAVFGFVKGTYDFYSLTDFTFDLSKYVLWRRNLEDANDVLGLKKSWEIINDKIKVYPTRSFDIDNQVGVLYSTVPTIDEIESDDWIREYALNKAKHILGTIRGKFSGFSAPGGQAQTDGEALKTESSQRMTELIDELKLNRPAPPMTQF